MSKGFLTFKDGHMLLDIAGFVNSKEGRESIASIISTMNKATEPERDYETEIWELTKENAALKIELSNLIRIPLELIARLRREGDVSTARGQMDRLHGIADELDRINTNHFYRFPK